MGLTLSKDYNLKSILLSYISIASIIFDEVTLVFNREQTPESFLNHSKTHEADYEKKIQWKESGGILTFVVPSIHTKRKVVKKS